MISIKGVDLRSLPISGLQKVRELESFDGPLLTHFRHPSGEDYLYYWCDCDAAVNRWMVMRVGENSILRLINRLVPLDFVIPAGAKDDFVYFVDLDGMGRTIQVTLTLKNAVPDEYLPQPGAYPRMRIAGDERAYSILVEGALSLDELFDLPTKFSQAYSLQYTIATLRPESFNSFPWRGGFSSMHFYRGIAKKMPAEARADLDAVQLASPGFIRFVMERKPAELVVDGIKHFLDRESESQAAYDRLRIYVRDHKLNDLREKNANFESQPWKEHEESLARLSKELIEAMELQGGEVLLQATEGPFESAKIAMSYAQRLKELARAAADGTIVFPR